MAKNKFSLNLEITTQPENFHAIKVGVTMHEVEVEYESNEELEEKVIEKQNILQNILVKAKNLALTENIYSSEVFYHTKNNESVSVKIIDENQDNKRNSLEDILGEDEDIESLEDFDLDSDILEEGDIFVESIEEDDGLDII